MADLDVEQLAARLEQSGDYRILRRVPVLTRYADDDPTAVKRLVLSSTSRPPGSIPSVGRPASARRLPPRGGAS